MEQVFVSYAHKNREFVDRLVKDLTYSGVPATYDKWLLKVGDSIIEKIAVSDASSVIAVLSKASVKSHWVSKELSLGVTSEIGSKEVKVLPAIIEKCKIPPMLKDKLYADFRDGYYYGLRDLLRTLNPESEELYRERYRMFREIDDIAADLRTVMARGQTEQVRKWFRSHPLVLVLLFGRLWAFCDAVPDFAFGRNREVFDYLIANGQSFSFDFQAVRLGPLNWSDANRDDILKTASSMHEFVIDCLENHDEFRRAACIRFSESQMVPPTMDKYSHGESGPPNLRATILLGRRDEYSNKENAIRHEVVNLTDGLVEVASYDRFLDAIEKSKERWL
jgi:hypothetical protein